MGGRRSMFLPRFVHGSSNEEVIVGILGNASLSSVKNSLSPGLLQQPPTKLFFFSLCVE